MDQEMVDAIKGYGPESNPITASVGPVVRPEVPERPEVVGSVVYSEDQDTWFVTELSPKEWECAFPITIPSEAAVARVEKRENRTELLISEIRSNLREFDMHGEVRWNGIRALLLQIDVLDAEAGKEGT